MRPLILLLCICSVSFAGIIPADRKIDWSQGYAGVQGGISNRPVWFDASLNGADKTGVTNCSTLLSDWFSSPSATHKAIYFPAGTYKFSTVMLNQFYDNVTVRGDGIGLTIFKPTTGSANGAFDIGSSEYPRPSTQLAISSGATNGSTNVVVSSGTSVVVGKLIRIEQTNPDWVRTVNGLSNNMSFMFKCTAKSGNTITFWPPLPFTLTNSPALVVYPNYLISGIGFEDLTFDMTNSTSSSAVFVEQAYGCWFKNVEIRNALRKQLWFINSIHCEVRECYTRDANGSGPNHEGIDFYGDDCWNLIENNICINSGYPMIILGDFNGGCSGNIIGYNYCANLDSGSSVAGYAISDNHGPHNMMNLIEGNVAQNFASDGYFGGSSHSTLFRNYFSGVYDKVLYLWPYAICLDHWATSYNIVGNVLGSNTYSASYQETNNNYSGTQATIYRLGFPNIGNSSYSGTGTNPSDAAYFDLGVQGTAILHGNYDYVTTSTVWDATIADHALPNSYYLTSKPQWFSNLVWPAIGSDLSPMVSLIPAQARYLAIDYSSTNPPVAGTVLNVGTARVGQIVRAP